MKQITDFNEFAFLTIEENLKIAEYAMSKPKSPDSDSCYGMSAFVLMASVIDIIGTFYCSGHFEYITPEAVRSKHGLGRCSEHFNCFFKRFIPGKYSKKEKRIFYEYARCKATHNGVLGVNVLITILDSPDGCFFKYADGVSTIYLKHLYSVVSHSYEAMKKESKDVTSPVLLGPTTGITTN